MRAVFLLAALLVVAAAQDDSFDTDEVTFGVCPEADSNPSTDPCDSNGYCFACNGTAALEYNKFESVTGSSWGNGCPSRGKNPCDGILSVLQIRVDSSSRSNAKTRSRVQANTEIDVKARLKAIAPLDMNAMCVSLSAEYCTDDTTKGTPGKRCTDWQPLYVSSTSTTVFQGTIAAFYGSAQYLLDTYGEGRLYPEVGIVPKNKPLGFDATFDGSLVEERWVGHAVRMGVRTYTAITGSDDPCGLESMEADMASGTRCGFSTCMSATTFVWPAGS